MLREGDGEKLESIAETEHLPAPRVRQRVSRLRRHLKAHWQKEVAVLAALGVLITGLYLFLKRPQPGLPIANEDVARAEEMRKQAFEKCLAKEWNDCVQKLDDAKRLDPAGDTAPTVQQARENAAKAKGLPPTAPTVSVFNNNDTAPPVESAPPPVMPAPTGSGYYPIPTATPKSIGPTKGSFESSPPPPPAKPQGKIQGKKAAPTFKPAPKSVTSELSGSDLGSNNIGKTGFKVPNAPSKNIGLDEKDPGYPASK
jgi:hypothetical protein